MKHVLICGAGAVGLCCALFLRERGYQVTVIERESAGADGCSFGNAGMIVPSHFTPLAAPGAIGLGLRQCFLLRSRGCGKVARFGLRGRQRIEIAPTLVQHRKRLRERHGAIAVAHLGTRTGCQ